MTSYSPVKTSTLRSPNQGHLVTRPIFGTKGTELDYYHYGVRRRLRQRLLNALGIDRVELTDALNFWDRHECQVGFLRAKTGKIVHLAILTWCRAMTACELPTIRACGIVIVWDKDGWWMVIFFFCWLVHWARYRNNDAFTGLVFDFSGETFSPVDPCLLAHRRHREFFFTTQDDRRLDEASSIEDCERDNCTVQADIVNPFLKSHRASTIIVAVESNRSMVVRLIQRLQAATLFELEDNVLEEIRQGRYPAVSEALFEELEDIARR